MSYGKPWIDLTLFLPWAAFCGSRSDCAVLGPLDALNPQTKKLLLFFLSPKDAFSIPIIVYNLKIFFSGKMLRSVLDKCTFSCKMRGGLNKRAITPLIWMLETLNLHFWKGNWILHKIHVFCAGCHFLRYKATTKKLTLFRCRRSKNCWLSSFYPTSSKVVDLKWVFDLVLLPTTHQLNHDSQ